MTREEIIEEVKAAFDIWEGEYDTGNDWSKAHKARDMAIKAIEQEPRKGRWIKKYHADEDGLEESCSAECSSCHKRSKGYAREDGYGLKFMYYDFCPKCGSDNREVRE